VVFACSKEREDGCSTSVVMRMNVEGKRGRRIPKKKRWLETIESVIKASGVCVGDVEDRDRRRCWTRVADRDDPN